MGNVQFDSQGNPTSASSSPAINKDVMAFIQKSLIHQPGVYGNQEHQNSNVAFNNAIQSSVQKSGIANVLKNKTAPQNYVRTHDNYILTEKEHYAINSTCDRLSQEGVVPFDTLQNFFYILAGTDSLSDLEYIGAVTGIDEISDQQYIRNITGICSIPTIYKVGYLSHGVASVNQRYSAQYLSSSQYDDYRQSSGGLTSYTANYAGNLGVIGQVALGIASNLIGNQTGILANAPSLTSSSIYQSVGALSNYASGETLSPTTISAVLNPTATAQSTALQAGPNAINSLLNMSPLGGALSSFGALGGVVAASLLGGTGGGALGGFMSGVVMGQRLKTSQIANNPMLTPPSYAGRSFFGEAPVSLPATDQVFCRRVGSFGSTNGGSGVVSFSMQNFASMGGSMNLSSLVSSLVLGSSEPPPMGTFMGNHISNTTENIASILNVSPFSKIEPRRSDNAIPFLLSMSAAIVGEKFSPFGSKPITGGWALAASAANDIQKYQPQFLETCKTSL